jgi:hypothetical protein
MVLLAVSIAPIYAQNLHIDEQEQQIRDEIKDCEAKVTSDDSLTEASKTVMKRNCVTETRNKNTQNYNTHEYQNKIKIKLENLQRCEDWYSPYQFLDEPTFKIQKNAQMVESCIILYNDPLWKYDGENRKNILSEKLDELSSEISIKTNPSDNFIKVAQKDYDRIQNLEKKIVSLENDLKNKDLIILEQMNVIMNLANTIKNAIFDGIKSVYPFV